MEVNVQGTVPPAPFLSAKELFETEFDLTKPVIVNIRDDPDSRTWAAHYDDRHVLNIARPAATSVMARELSLHEFSHMHRHEQAHPSHTFKTEEALYLALTGKEIESRIVSHCYQIANHMKDIYADDITFQVGPTDKLTAFLESELATSVSDRAINGPQKGRRLTTSTDPAITADNAAFAVALLERHNAIPPDHRIYDLAYAAAKDAPEVSFQEFKTRFKQLVKNPDKSDVRRALSGIIQEYANAQQKPNRAAD
ncbi:MAG: DUF5781 family protein [Halobacteriaceae archaeon]